MGRLIDTRERQSCSVSWAAIPTKAWLCATNSTHRQRGVIEAARGLIMNERSISALDALDELWTAIESLGLENSFEIDLVDVSSLDYYTGLCMKVFVHGAGSSVGRGGRYDGLTGSFGRAEPAVGFVLNLDALTEVLARRGSVD